MAVSGRPAVPRQTPHQLGDRLDAYSEHARERWRERVLDERPDVDYPVEVAWQQAESIHYKPISAVYLRFHVATDRLLLAERYHNGREAVSELVTVLNREWHDDEPGVKRAMAAIRRERGRE